MAATVASLRRRRAVVQSTRAPPKGWGRFPGVEAEVKAEAIGPWMGTHGGFCRRCRRLPAIGASAPMGRLFSPRWLFRCSVRWLHSSLSRLSWPPARLLAAPPMSPGLRPRPGTGWRRRCGWRTRAAQDQAGSLRCTPSWRAESARDASCRSCPIQRLFFFTIDVAQSCAREWTHVSCFKDYDNHGLESDAAISGPEIYVYILMSAECGHH